LLFVVFFPSSSCPLPKLVHLTLFSRFFEGHHTQNAPIDRRQSFPARRNPTYLLQSSSNSKRYVVRTRPPGPLISKTAHAVDREYKVLSALGEDGSVPVPKVYHLCKDESIIGRQFYLMSYLDGRKFEDVRMPEVDTKEEREALYVLSPFRPSLLFPSHCFPRLSFTFRTARRTDASFLHRWLSAIQTLAAIHALDPKKIGLDDFGSSAAFYPRQIRFVHLFLLFLSSHTDSVNSTSVVLAPCPASPPLKPP
jgi:hypothetical protein